MQIKFEKGRDGAAIGKIDGKISFPARSGWGKRLPKPGETWTVEITGQNSAGTVNFLRAIESPEEATARLAAERAAIETAWEAKQAAIKARNAALEVERLALLAEIELAIRAAIESGPTSPEPVCKSTPERIEFYLPARPDALVEIELEFNGRDRRILIIDAEECTASIRTERYGEYVRIVPESDDGYRAGGSVVVTGWRSVGREDATDENLDAIAKASERFAERMISYREDLAWHEEVSQLNDWLSYEVSSKLFKAHRAEFDVWVNASFANWVRFMKFFAFEGSLYYACEGEDFLTPDPTVLRAAIQRHRGE